MPASSTGAEGLEPRTLTTPLTSSTIPLSVSTASAAHLQPLQGLDPNAEATPLERSCPVSESVADPAVTLKKIVVQVLENDIPPMSTRTFTEVKSCALCLSGFRSYVPYSMWNMTSHPS